MGPEPTGARYGVVVCPGCRHAKGIELSAATTRCGRCGKQSRMASLRVFYRCDDPARLREAVGAVEAQTKGGDEALIDIQALQDELEAPARGPATAEPPTDVIQYAASTAAAVVSNAKKVERILEALDAYGPPEGFSQDMVEQAFEAAGLPLERAESELRKAIAQDALFEPRPGRLKLL